MAFCCFVVNKTAFGGFAGIHSIEFVESYRLICVSTLETASGRILPSFKKVLPIFGSIIAVWINPTLVENKNVENTTIENKN